MKLYVIECCAREMTGRWGRWVPVAHWLRLDTAARDLGEYTSGSTYRYRLRVYKRVDVKRKPKTRRK